MSDRSRCGKARVLTAPNELRYVGCEVVRRMMDGQDEGAIATFVEHTAAKRHAHLVEPVRLASWVHRRLATGGVAAAS